MALYLYINMSVTNFETAFRNKYEKPILLARVVLLALRMLGPIRFVVLRSYLIGQRVKTSFFCAETDFS